MRAVQVPGAGRPFELDAVGAEVAGWQPSQRVGVGWYGGHRGYCESYRRRDFMICRYGLVTGISYGGGKRST
jgi:D-arabinose 1-dehydrogenase-like Zn-dependent alcohol dehydrogenase